MIISDIQEARSTLDWVKEHLEATGGKYKRVYIKGLEMVDELLKEIQKLLAEAKEEDGCIYNKARRLTDTESMGMLFNDPPEIPKAAMHDLKKREG